MDEQRGDRIETLFHQAADLPPAERQALLDRACADDPGLRAALERLLADDARLHSDAGKPFLESPLVHPALASTLTAASANGPTLPVRVGRYRVLRLLGEGGMGAVYEAEQDNPRRTVALKIIRPAIASAALLSRFRHESQILGRLHHPGIAQVYEAGLAEDGQPFFAMEFIRGLPLDEYARLRALTLQGRVELLARVCDAVQHAHDQGVIHRDLKPANILVEESGQPKVVDFGAARATNSDLLTGAGLTQTGQLLGTPNYMSPEQVTGDPAAIDHRADVYALGVILFELAAHRLPYRLENRPLAEAARLILEEDPPRLGSLNPELRGDVETMVAKALEKDPARRYGSAADLAADLRRWLAHEPILARPTSALYQLRKFARRNRALVGGALATGLALVLGTVFSLLFAFGEAQQRREADRSARAAEESARQADKLSRDALAAKREAEEDAVAARAMSDFLGGLFEEADPFVLTSRVFGDQPFTNPTALDIVERAASRLANRDTLKEKPLVRAALLDKVGHVYLSLGEGAKAGPFVLEALELRQKHLPAPHADRAASLHNAGFLHLTKGNFKKSQQLFAEAFEMRRQLLGGRSAPAMASRAHLGLALYLLRDRQCEPILKEVVEFQKGQLKAAEENKSEHISKEALECAFYLFILADFCWQGEKRFEAMPYLLEAQKAARKITNKEMAALCDNIVRFRQQQVLGQIDGAAKDLREAMAIIARRAGQHHFLHVILQRELGLLYYSAKRPEEAEKVFLEAVANHRKSIGADGQGLANLSYYTACSIAEGSLQRAKNLEARTREAGRVEHHARDAYDLAKESGEGKFWLAIYANFLADTYLHHRPEPDNAAAERFAREALLVREEFPGIESETAGHARCCLLLALARQGKLDEVEQIVHDLLGRVARPTWSGHAVESLPPVARILASAGRTKTALLLLDQAAGEGYYDLRNAQSDPAFRELCQTEAYQQLLSKLAK
jgi:predicted Ser/Thr protein kinase